MRGIQLVPARQGLTGPGGADQREMVGRQLSAILAVQPEGAEGGHVAAGPDPHLQPAAAEHIQHRGIFGHAQRQFQRQGDDARAEPDAVGLRGHMRQEHQRRRQPALGLMEMMLRHPGTVEAAALGVDDLLRRQTVTLRRRGRIQHPGEEAQPAEQGQRHACAQPGAKATDSGRFSSISMKLSGSVPPFITSCSAPNGRP